ncbi:MAG: spore coat U domain-containing protein [Porticoccus sp.]|nr:spore coat U domain-containing protein [Porticoccus sp.]
MQKLPNPVKPRYQTALTVLVLVQLSLISLPAHAVGDCSVSATGVSFGSYTYTTPSPADTAGNIEVSCTLIGIFSLLVSYDISLSTGNSGSYSPRSLVFGANNLSYNLYTNAARTNIWGDGSASTSSVSDGYLLGLFTVVRNYTVYGRLPAAQNKPAGSYADTIVVTITY